MGRTAGVVHSAMVVAGLLGVAGASSAAAAQRARTSTAGTTQSEAQRPNRPFPTSIRTTDARPSGDRRIPSRFRNNQRSGPAIVYYIPVPAGYGYGPAGGGVYDTDGRPLYEAYDRQVASQYTSPAGTPDLSGSAYVVGEGGAMIVDVGDGIRRTVPSCAALSAQGTPDGHPRTIFYQPPADGIILRPGSSGRVQGAPGVATKVCYAVDEWGRTELRY